MSDQPKPVAYTKPNRKGLAKDEHDETADRLYDLVRDARADQKVIDAIATALRDESEAAYQRGRVVGFAEGMR